MIFFLGDGGECGDQVVGRFAAFVNLVTLGCLHWRSAKVMLPLAAPGLVANDWHGADARRLSENVLVW